MACTDITFSDGDNQGFQNKITTLSGSLTDIVVNSGQLMLVTAAGTFNAAGEIVPSVGSVTMIIPTGVVNPADDVITDGDYDEIPETEFVGVPNVIVYAPRKVR